MRTGPSWKRRRRLAGLGIAAATVAAVGIPLQGHAAGSRVQEKDVNLDIAKRAAAHLGAYGIVPVLTRSNDTYVGLTNRTDVARRTGAALFVSIHNNAGPSSASGTEIYKQVQGAPDLAADIQRATAQVMGGRVARIYARSSSSGPDRDYYSVLRTSSVPAVIFEGSYVSNPTEARLLATSAAFRQQLADSVADGVIAWVQAHAPASHDPGPPPSPPVGTAETTELVAIPANVRGVAPDWSKAVLTWSPAQNPLGADGARLFRDGQLIADLAPGTTSFTDTWVRPGTSYSYELRSTLPKVAGQNIVLQSDPVALRVVVPLRRTTVVLDPGHGGKDSGAAGSF